MGTLGIQVSKEEWQMLRLSVYVGEINHVCWTGVSITTKWGDKFDSVMNRWTIYELQKMSMNQTVENYGLKSTNEQGRVFVALTEDFK